MHSHPHLRRIVALVIAGIVLLAFASAASADPPGRVARLAYINGPVSFSPAGDDDWFDARVNRPLTTGDRLWSDRGARSELQVGGATIRMGAGTSLAVLNLDDRITQLQLTQGVLNLRVWRVDPEQTFEVDTPNLAFVPRQPGSYRIEIEPDGDATMIVVRAGQGDAYGDDAAYTLDTRQTYRFHGTDLRDYEHVARPRLDEFDRWALDRDRGYERSVSARYVSPDVIGYQDLDTYGTWRSEPEYGNVWMPSRVPAGWSPYRDGHWAWIDPWGWTWVDDAPWGFAVSHYGRWANTRGAWVWVPGPPRARAYYAPALVAFVGGDNFQLSISSGNVGGVGWFPLAPREVYRPSYPVSRRYYENFNVSNTVINTTVINNTYNTVNVTDNVYVNRRVPGAVIAVPTTTFVQSQPVSRAAAPVTRELVTSAPVANAPRIAPTERSLRGASERREQPPQRALAKPVVARTAPPAPKPGFAAQQPQLSAQPGKPLEEDARRNLKPATSAPAVKVVAQPERGPGPLPAPPASASRGGDAKGQSAERKAGDATPRASRQGPERSSAPATATAPEPAREARGKSDDRGKSEPRQQASSPPRAPEPQVPAASSAPAPRAAPAPSAQSPEVRGEADDRNKADQDRKSDQRAPTEQRAAADKGGKADDRGKPDDRARPDERGKSDDRGATSQRAPAPAPASPSSPARPPANPAPQAAAPPAPRAQPAPNVSKGEVSKGEVSKAEASKAESRPAADANARSSAKGSGKKSDVDGDDKDRQKK